MLHKLCLSAKRCKNQWGLSYVGLWRAVRGLCGETRVFESNGFGIVGRGGAKQCMINERRDEERAGRQRDRDEHRKEVWEE